MLDCIQSTFEKCLYLGSWLVGLDKVPLELDSYRKLLVLEMQGSGLLTVQYHQVLLEEDELLVELEL